MATSSPAFARQKIAVDFASLSRACPKGIYVAPLPSNPLAWSGVLFVRKGPYANAILRFQISFPEIYPRRPPVVTFQSDLFHPLVTPLTTYTYSTRDTGSDTVSAVDEGRLPPGGLSLRHGFPEWFHRAGDDQSPAKADQAGTRSETNSEDVTSKQTKSGGTGSRWQPPHVLEVLQYMRIIFESEKVLDSIPIGDVANAGAWHAWRSYRVKLTEDNKTTSGAAAAQATSPRERAQQSPRQQPGGARRPGEWNWQGVWEDRVRKSINGSITNPVLYGHDNEVINFLRMDQEMLDNVSPIRASTKMALQLGGEAGPAAPANAAEERFVFTTIRYDPQLVHSAENTIVSCNKPCPFYMFEHHYTRLQVAKWNLASWADDTAEGSSSRSAEAKELLRKSPGSPAELLHGLLSAIETWKKTYPTVEPESLRVKLRLYTNGQIRTEIFNPIPRLPLTTLFPTSLGTPAEHRDGGKLEWTISLDTQPTEPTESTIIKTYDRSAYDRARSAAKITSFAEQREVLLYTAQGLILDGSLSTPYFYRGGRWVTPSSNTGGQQGSTRRWALGKNLAAEDDVEAKSLAEGEVVFMSNAIKGFFPTTYQAKRK